MKRKKYQSKSDVYKSIQIIKVNLPSSIHRRVYETTVTVEKTIKFCFN